MRPREEPGARFRRAAGQFLTGVTVLTTWCDGEPHGMTVNAFASVSMEPRLVLVSLSTASRTCHRVRAAGVFAVTVLGAGQAELARWFADGRRAPGAPAFAGLDWQPGPGTGSPVLTGGLSYFDCLVEQEHPAGDHTVLIGRVRAFDVLSDGDPLLFLRSDFTDLGDSVVRSLPA